ncbi:MAG TPA: hypothetical protein VKV15_13130, partial [Bryobacteraceae bacterium]|nr:hypothetical protein [Bryobacteraceae bacterium]
GVAQAAESTARGATETQSAAQQLVEVSRELQSLVGQFKLNAEVAVFTEAVQPARSKAAFA